MILGGALILGRRRRALHVHAPGDPNFLGYWLPVGVLIGAGMGAITTGVSTAAALSVAPERFAAAVGLNPPRARSAARSASPCWRHCSRHRRRAFKDIYLFFTLATLAVAVAGSRQ